jgi:ABC-2 type transport system permease protein
MREAMALWRASWLTASSYRLSMAMSLGGLLVAMIPMYFVATALHPVLADSIRHEGGNYFAFLVVGVIAFSFLTASVNSLPGAVASGISTGTLEAMLATRVRLPALLAGMTAYSFTWTIVRAAAMVTFGVALGMRLSLGQSMLAISLLALIVVAHVGVGLIAASMVLAFRTTGPFSQIVLLLSGLLGGVYYPTSVIPAWLHSVSEFVPLTYGLRALRRAWLDEAGLTEILPDVRMLLGMTLVLVAAGVFTFHVAFRLARRRGTLAQY